MDEIINRNTPFKPVRIRSSRSCTGCKRMQLKDMIAWKPTKSLGAWKMDAVLCAAYVKPVKQEGARGKS